MSLKTRFLILKSSILVIKVIKVKLNKFKKKE